MFDPYHKWLGIPKGVQPPTHYQLLGIDPTETDPEVIEEAAIRQTTHLRGYQIGPHAQECTQLLNEIAQARKTLLNPTLRQQYNSRLAVEGRAPLLAAGAIRESVTAESPRAATAPALIPEFAGLDEPGEPSEPRPRRQRNLDVSKSNTPLIIAVSIGGGFVALLIVGLVIALLWRGAPDQPAIVANPPAVAPRPQPKIEPPPAQPPWAQPQPMPRQAPPQAPPEEPPPKPEAPPPNNDPLAKLPANAAEAPLDAWRVDLPDSVSRVAISADGSTAAAGTSRSAYVLDCAKKGWRPMTPTFATDFKAFALSPDGAVLAIGDATSATLWDLATNKLMHTLAHDGATWVGAAAFSADGRKLVTGTTSPEPENCLVRFWDVATGKLIWSAAGHERHVSGVAVLPGGDVVSRGVEYSYRRWNGTTGAPVRVIANQRLLRENFASDGRFVLATQQDNRTIELWDMEQNRAVRTFGDGRNAIRLAWNGGKIALAVDDQGAVSFWDVTEGKLLANRNDHARPVTVAISTDGKTAVSGGHDRTVRVWNLRRLNGAGAAAKEAGDGAKPFSQDYVTENTIAKLPPRSALSERVGGEGGSPFFRFHRDGKPLLGLLGTVGSWNNRPMVRQLHPLYSRDPIAPNADETVLLAKEGYAVAGLNAVGEEYCWAIQVVFCRQQGDKLDLADSYTSPWLSEPRDDPPRRLGATGALVLGIYGRQGLNNDALGVILALPKDAFAAAARTILKKNDAFTGAEPTDHVFRQQNAKSYSLKLRAGQTVNIAASGAVPLFVRLTNDQNQCVAADRQQGKKARIYNFSVPRTGDYRITVVSLISGRAGPFTLSVTEGAVRPDAP